MLANKDGRHSELRVREIDRSVVTGRASKDGEAANMELAEMYKAHATHVAVRDS